MRQPFLSGERIMAQFCTLCSSSSGNSSYIGYSGGGILVDAGLNAKQLCLAMDRTGVDPNSIKAIFITHEHTDHISALRVFASKFSVPVYATEGTLNALIKIGCVNGKFKADVIDENGIDINGMYVKPFKTSHDSAQSCGYTVYMPYGHKLAVATDTGYVTDEMKSSLVGCDLVLLESNHDLNMLKTGPYPYYLKQRILSKKGHLSNDDCAEFAKYLVHNGTKRIVLGHLSRENNDPVLAFETTNNALGAAGLLENEDYQLYAAPASNSERMFKL